MPLRAVSLLVLLALGAVALAMAASARDVRQELADDQEIEAPEELAPPEQVPAVRPVDRSPSLADNALARSAANSLARIGPAAVPALVESLTNGSPQTRRHAAWSLGRMGPEAIEALPALIAALDDRDDETRTLAARALGELGPAAAPAIPRLIELLEEPVE